VVLQRYALYGVPSSAAYKHFAAYSILTTSEHVSYLLRSTVAAARVGSEVNHCFGTGSLNGVSLGHHSPGQIF